MQGEVIKDWIVTGRVGKGGMGEVWVAEHQLVKTKVAIKLLLADVSRNEPEVKRFFNEAIAVSKIKHAGIAKIFDVGFHGERAYLVMEFLEGETLAARLRRLRRLGVGQATELCRQIAGVLEATHHAGITHRDLKPDNIFIVPDHELATKERVRIIDFGIAKLGESGSGMTSSASMGTPAYMAPEQWRNATKADGRADIYSLGCVLFELLCGRPPFVAASIGEACTAHLSEPPPRARSFVATLPAEVDDLIDRMLAKSPDDRPSLVDVARTLALHASTTPSAATLDTLPSNSAPMSSPRGTPIGTPDAIAETQPSGVGSDATSATSVDKSGGAGQGSPKISTHVAPVAGDPVRRRLYIVAGIVAISLGAGLYAITRPKVGAPKPASLKAPSHGLQALDAHHAPTPANVGSLGSEPLWLSARDDFAEACKQPGAPARWCAAAEFSAGQALLVTGKLAEAEPHYHAAIKVDPTWAAPHLGLKDIRSFKQDLDGALAEARTAERLDPTSWTAVLASARSYAHASKLREAIGEYQRALALSPRNPLILAELAMTYNAANMGEEAEKTGALALSIDGSLVHVHLMNADRALARGDGATALATADKVLAMRPKNPTANMLRADALVLLGRIDEAKAAFRTTVEVFDQDGRQYPNPRMTEIRNALANDQLPKPPYDAARGGTAIDLSIDSMVE